ncbi:nitroreductase family protein [Planctomicrobium piriforme]|uniref:Nitroreductase n=1 Tax=Planctomicrobium piriforme TaxID=1576369 RepID=A0A1I3QYT6_9PLAN|nr:nitroreductase family protein [Planctomicrobium piriforme]SFJ38619.1 Nitroreductase [Planctomicrobium piriforme]
MASLPDPLDHRSSDHDILELFLKRWSPRAMTGDPIPPQTLHRLFEAARWAPSTYNEQEWRFLYAHRESADWKTFFGLLMEANQIWCQHAGVLIVALSKKTFTKNGKPNAVHSLDTGMAVQNLLLQAASIPGLMAHGMGGFDRNKTRVALGVPDDYEIECMIAVGIAGDPEKLPPELKEREIPSQRKPVGEFAKPGRFAF